MEAGHFLYFAFGSNLLAKRIRLKNPSAKAMAVAKLQDYKLIFNHYSRRWHGAAASILPADNEEVVGVLWQLERKHLATLDDQEGVRDRVYERLNVNVEILRKLADDEPVGALGDKVTCVTYKLLPERMTAVGKDALPSINYKNVILSGARENHLPDSYISKLEKIEDNGYHGHVEVDLNLSLAEDPDSTKAKN